LISGADATAVADEARPGLGPRWWTVNSTTFTFASGIRESANLRKFLREEAPALEGDKVSAMGHGEDLTDHRSQKLNLYWLLPSALHLGFVNELLVRGSARAMAAKHQAVVEAVEKNLGKEWTAKHRAMATFKYAGSAAAAANAGSIKWPRRETPGCVTPSVSIIPAPPPDCLIWEQMSRLAWLFEFVLIVGVCVAIGGLLGVVLIAVITGQFCEDAAYREILQGACNDHSAEHEMFQSFFSFLHAGPEYAGLMSGILQFVATAIGCQIILLLTTLEPHPEQQFADLCGRFKLFFFAFAIDMGIPLYIFGLSGSPNNGYSRVYVESASLIMMGKLVSAVTTVWASYPLGAMKHFIVSKISSVPTTQMALLDLTEPPNNPWSAGSNFTLQLSATLWAWFCLAGPVPLISIIGTVHMVSATVDNRLRVFGRKALPSFMRGKVADFFNIQASKAPPVWTCRGAMVIESMLLVIVCTRSFLNNLFYFPQSPGALAAWPAVFLVVNISGFGLVAYILVYMLDMSLYKRHLGFTRLVHAPLELIYGVSWAQYKMTASAWVAQDREARARARTGAPEMPARPVPGWTDPTIGAEFSVCFPGLTQPYRRHGNLDLMPPRVDTANGDGGGGNALKQLLRNTLDRLIVLALGL